MSFHIQWNLLGQEECSHLIHFINTQFEKAIKPDFLGLLKVNHPSF